MKQSIRAKKIPLPTHKVFAAEELTDERVHSIAKTRMSSRHDHLNRLLVKTPKARG